MQLFVNNHNTLIVGQLRQVVLGNPITYVVNAAIPLTMTVYDSVGTPQSGLTAVSIPNVDPNNCDYGVDLTVGNLTPAGTYEFVMTSTGGYAGYVKVDNTSLSLAVRRS